jgi:hypothetical protein
MYNPSAHDNIKDNPYFTYSDLSDSIKIFNAKNAINPEINKNTE